MNAKVTGIIHKFLWSSFIAISTQSLTMQWTKANNSELETTSLTRQFDWVLFVEGASFDNFLNYPGSGLASMNRFTASYQQTGASFMVRGSASPISRRENYQEFWYHDGRPIGQRRSCRPHTRATEQGAIFLRPQKDGELFSHSSANCLVRLFLESRLNQSIVAAIVVPQDLFEKISTEFGQLNFSEVQKDTKAEEGNLTFRLLSDPPGFELHFYYVDHR